LVEPPGEIVHDLQPRIAELPRASLPESLYVVISRHRYKNIGVAFGLFILMMNQKADQIFRHRKGPAISIFDMPFPGLSGTFKENSALCACQVLAYRDDWASVE